MKTIHINCDLGEGGAYDAALMPLISACNIACGGHVGTLETMQHTVNLAIENNVEIGAHPAYPDKENFGRHSLKMAPEDIKQSVIAQILSLKQITEAKGGVLSHVKPHGALYNDSFLNETVAQVVIEAVSEFNEDLVLYAPENGRLAEMASGKINIRLEAFADRNYQADGRLVSRRNPQALISQKEAVFEHLFFMVSEGKIAALEGANLTTLATTFCLHSDTPNLIEILKYLHRELALQNIKIQSYK